MVKTSTSVRSPLSPTLWPPEAFIWWRSLGLALLLVAAAFIPAVLFLAVLVSVGQAHVRDFQSLTWQVVAGQFVSYAFSFAVLIGFLPALARRSLRELGLRAPRAGDLAYGVVGAVVMVIVVAGTGGLQQAIFHLKPDEVQVQWLRAARGPMIGTFVALVCIGAPFFEELTFRGFIFNALWRYVPASVAVAVSAIAFGFVHMQPGNLGAIVPLIAGGVVLALVYYRSGSLVASMVTHSLFNLFMVLLVVVFHQV